MFRYFIVSKSFLNRASFLKTFRVLPELFPTFKINIHFGLILQKMCKITFLWFFRDFAHFFETKTKLKISSEFRSRYWGVVSVVDILKLVYNGYCSMTTLLMHTVAHFTKPSFMPKTNNQPPFKPCAQFSMSKNTRILII